LSLLLLLLLRWKVGVKPAVARLATVSILLLSLGWASGSDRALLHCGR
jgi:hypothetical protein